MKHYFLSVHQRLTSPRAGAPQTSKPAAGRRLLLHLLAAAGLWAAMSACAKSDTYDPAYSIQPKGPKPAWGPTITPQMLTVIEKLDSLTGGVDLTQLTAQQARQVPSPQAAARAVMRDYGIKMLYPNVDTTGRSIPVENGSIRIRVYTPSTGAAPYPGIVYYHGGGWVLANLDTYDASARALAERVGAVVVSVAYRRAPEYKYPTAHNDSFAGYRWVLQNAASIRVDPRRVAVAGESAGGNLAAAVCMMARNAGVALPRHQLLVYPIAGYNFNTPSYQEYANAKPLSRPLMKWFFDKYLRTPADGFSPLIDLVDAPNLAGLPSATVINAQIDPLQSEGQQYAARLQAAGVPVTAQVYTGVTHEFFGMAAVIPEARAAQLLASATLREALK